MTENSRIGITQMIPSRCFVNSYEDLMTLSLNDKVLVWLKDPQAGAYFVEAEIVFNGIEDELYNKEYWDSVGFNSRPIKSFSVGIADYYPLVIKTVKILDPARQNREIAFRYVDVLDVIRYDEEIKKYSTKEVEYWNEVYSRANLKRV